MKLPWIYMRRVPGAWLAFLLCQSFFCPGPDPVEVPVVRPESVELILVDTLNLRAGARVTWTIEQEEDDEETISYFSLFYKLHPDSTPVLGVTQIPGSLRAIQVPFPDTAFGVIYYGLSAVVEAGTGQQWESDSLIFGVLTLTTRATDMLPAADSYNDQVMTLFQGRSTNDRGERFRIMIFGGRDSILFARDTTFPFSGGEVHFPVTPLTDSLRLPGFGHDTLPYRWCLKSTEYPGNDPVRLKQSLTCSQFYKVF